MSPHAHAPATGSNPGESRRREHARGQSELIGVLLLLVITVLGTVAVVAVGSGVLADSQTEAELQRTEHAMTALDSRSVLVALGKSDVQRVDLGDSGSGHYEVDPSAGWLRIVHSNYTGADGSDETIYNGTLGAVVYRNGDRTITYQGGGVWRSDGEGAVMVSPPEFHYRDETLTLPLVQLRGTGYVSGTATATVTAGRDPLAVYPNATTSDPTKPYDGPPYGSDGRPYANPVRHGMIEVTVHSAAYEAWASYFRTYTEGTVTVDHATETVSIELTASGMIGTFDMPREGNSVEVRGLVNEHAIENFTVVLAPDDTDAARFNNLQWSLYVDSGSRQLEYHLRKSGDASDAGVACDREEVSLTIYYSDANGDPYHGWRAENAFTTGCVDRDDDGVRDEVRLVANLTGLAQLSMQDLSSTDLEQYNPSGSSRLTSVDFQAHRSAVGWEPTTFSDAGDDDTTVGNLTNHYLTLLGEDFDLTVDDKNSDTVHEGASWATLVYDGGGRVTYMHVTENHVEVNVTD